MQRQGHVSRRESILPRADGDAFSEEDTHARKRALDYNVKANMLDRVLYLQGVRKWIQKNNPRFLPVPSRPTV